MREYYISLLEKALSVLPQAELEYLVDFISELYSLDLKGGECNE